MSVQGRAARQPFVLATRNAGKLRELRALFEIAGLEVVDLTELGISEDPVAEDAVEAFETFEENALAKARYFSALLPGRDVVADDSGLVVDALHGAPGVRSKRWSAEPGLHGRALDAANNTRLVRELEGRADRAARFVCAAAWCSGARSLVARGEVPGRIVDVPRGSNGFGYDPHFHVDELGMTLAEAKLDEKSRVSHRARAFARLLEELVARA